MGDVSYLWDNPKVLARTGRALQARGAEILGPTSQWEALRFRTQFGLGIVHRNKRGGLNPNLEARNAFMMLNSGTAGSFAPNRSAGKRVSGERRRGEIEAVMLRDGTRCFYCGIELRYDATGSSEITMEHLVSKTHGGPEHIANKFAAHKGCNMEAGHLSAPEKIALRDRLRAELHRG